MTISGRGTSGPAGSVRSVSSGTPSHEGSFPLQTRGADGEAWSQVKPPGMEDEGEAGKDPTSPGNATSRASHRIPQWVYRIARR